jgi:cytochrome c peroxidase
VGWTGPDEAINAHGAVYEGAVAGVFGNRKPPSAAYGGDSPILHLAPGKVWTGGMFWDGRATGARLGDPLAEQAEGPFLNKREQNNASEAVVVAKVQASTYSGLFAEVCGTGTDLELYDCIGRSIAAYERSKDVSAYTSKFDLSRQGMAKLSAPERMGFQLFQGKANCTRCHPSNGKQPDFTDFTYDNLGVPKNPENPFYTEASGDPSFVDVGLGGFLKSIDKPASVYGPQLGTFKVPTLRNVDKRPDPLFVKAYSHNGFFKSLAGIVHFYNTRDVLPTCADDFTEAQALAANCWPAPEYPSNLNTKEVGNLGLTEQEEAAIVAFLKTLSDGYK